MANFIYAFDLSLSCSGVVIFDEMGNPVHVTSIPTNEKLGTALRLKHIATELLTLRELYPPKRIILERAFSRFNQATAALYRVHGVVNMLFWDVEQIYYTPKDIKATLVRGNATKAQLAEKIKQKYNQVVFQNDDESDAFAVGLTYFLKNNLMERW